MSNLTVHLSSGHTRQCDHVRIENEAIELFKQNDTMMASYRMEDIDAIMPNLPNY